MKCDRCDFVGLRCTWVTDRCALCSDCLFEIFGEKIKTSNAVRYILLRAGFDFSTSTIFWQGFNDETKTYYQPMPLAPQYKTLLDDPAWFKKLKMNRLLCCDNIQEFTISAPYPCEEGIWVRKRILGSNMPILSCYYIDEHVVYKNKKMHLHR